MNNRGLTLPELIVAVVIVGIIILALICQWDAEDTFRTMINDRITATNEASIAMRHMTRVLRYAKSSTVITNSDIDYDTSITATVDHAVAGDNLPEFPNDVVVTYGRKNDGTFEVKMGPGGTSQIISKYITDFPVTTAWWDGAYKNLTIHLTATKGSRSSSLNTIIRVLGR